MSSALTGSVDFFEQLTLRHLTDIYQTANALLPNQEIAEEVVESTYLEARRSLKTDLNDASARVWLFAILIKNIRRRRRWMLPFVVNRQSVPSRDEVLAALRRMPLNEAETVLLCDVQGFNSAELQEILALPAASVEKRLRVGRLRLDRDLDLGVGCATQALRV